MIDDVRSGAIPDLIQPIGSLRLQFVTVGRYARNRPKDALLLEGTVRFGALALGIRGVYRVIA
jgi:hypothetical protein